MLGIVKNLIHGSELAVDKKSEHSPVFRITICNNCSGTVSPVSCSECIININFGIAGKFSGKLFLFCLQFCLCSFLFLISSSFGKNWLSFFLRIEPYIFKQQNFSGL